MRFSCRVIVLGVILAAACLSAGYYIGYSRASHKIIYGELVSKLREDLFLYRLDEAGNTNRLEQQLRFLIFARSEYYDQNFRSEKVTNEFVARDLAEAHTIATQERTNVVMVTPDSIAKAINATNQTNTAKTAP